MLALKLGMTVGRLREEMSAYEYRQWVTYLGREMQRRELAEQRARGGSS